MLNSDRQDYLDSETQKKFNNVYGNLLDDKEKAFNALRKAVKESGKTHLEVILMAFAAIEVFCLSFPLGKTKERFIEIGMTEEKIEKAIQVIEWMLHLQRKFIEAAIEEGEK